MRLEVAKLIIFNSYGTETDQRKIYSGLLEMKKNASILSECPELLEILGYCSENGIGTSLNHDRATELYLDCLNVAENTNEKSRHGGKQRCLCRLVNMYMEDKNYKSALIYLEVLRPELDQLSQLPFPDAISQAHRMKYYIGRWGGGSSNLTVYRAMNRLFQILAFSFYVRIALSCICIYIEYILLYGLGAKKSVQQGIAWLTTAADEGDSDAAYKFGRYLHCQQELENEAKLRYQQGARSGHAGCMRELSLLLLADETDKSALDEDYNGGVEI